MSESLSEVSLAGRIKWNGNINMHKVGSGAQPPHPLPALPESKHQSEIHILAVLRVVGWCDGTG